MTDSHSPTILLASPAPNASKENARERTPRNGLLRPLTSSDAARDWFYYRLRRAAGTDVKRTLASSASDEIIGDAGSAGKTEQAILSAYEAAFGSNAGEAMEGDRA